MPLKRKHRILTTGPPGKFPAHFLIELFVFLLLSYMRCLYILEIKPLLVASLAYIFSESVGCLLILLMVFFAVQKFNKFKYVSFVYFCF